MKNIYLSRKRRTKKSKIKTRSKRQRGGNPDDQDDLDTSLFEAIKYKNYKDVDTALQKGADVNRTVRYIQEDGFDDDPDVITPLIHAIISGDEDMVKLLLTYPNIIVGTHDELALAEKYAPEDHEQTGIPSLIKDYIKMKRDFIRKKNKVTKELLNYKRHNIPSLQTRAYYQSPSALDTYINQNPGTIKRPYGKLGGKRRTRKAKRSKRKKVK
jgi:ankyrin repeat protein